MRKLSRSRDVGNKVVVLPLIEILGDQRVLIERHKGVLGYDRQRICIKLSYGIALIHGLNLEITYMSKTQLVISGRIQNVELKRSNH